MPAAELADVGKLVGSPYLPDRVVRVAEYHHRAERVGQLLFKIVKIDVILPVPVAQPAFKHGSAGIFNRVIENIVYGSEKDDPVPDVRDALHST